MFVRGLKDEFETHELEVGKLEMLRQCTRFKKEGVIARSLI